MMSLERRADNSSCHSLASCEPLLHTPALAAEFPSTPPSYSPDRDDIRSSVNRATSAVPAALALAFAVSSQYPSVLAALNAAW